MNPRCFRFTVLLIAGLAIADQGRGEVSDRFPLELRIDEQDGRLLIARDASPVATYVYRDREIPRPYFAQVHAPAGLPLTRHHPPRAGIDATDHATMHPGIWLAFGDLGGVDFWRNEGRIEHVEFVERPRASLDGQEGVVSFVVKNRYLARVSTGDKTICHELARHTIRATKAGYLLTFDSEFSGDEPFAFGDQEEMGLGLRLATPLAVREGSGAIANDAGGKNEKEVWGRAANWCDYGGEAATTVRPGNESGKLRIGLLLVPHSGNFRRSWMHARDYGFVAANPFGRKAFTGKEPSRVEVKPGEKLQLRYGVWAYSASADKKVDLSALAARYEELAADRK